MNCEIGIHEAFIELKQIICPFCKQPLEDEKKRDNTDEYYFCCDRREIVIDNGQIICRNCGIMRIFSEIGKILPQINGERKRMISLNFILIQVLRMMGLPFDKIPISKSKNTLASYRQYWTQIILLIGDMIKGIIVSD